MFALGVRNVIGTRVQVSLAAWMHTNLGFRGRIGPGLTELRDLGAIYNHWNSLLEDSNCG